MSIKKLQFHLRKHRESNMMPLFLICLSFIASSGVDNIRSGKRFLVPADEWKQDVNFLKGRFLKIDLSVQDSPSRMLAVYTDSSFVGEPSFRIDNVGRIYFGKDYCVRTRSALKETISPFIRCGYFYCKKESGAGVKWGYDEVIATDWLYSKTEQMNCPFKSNYYQSTENVGDGEISFLFIPIEENDLNREYVKIDVGHRKLYLDIRFCKHPENRDKCQMLNINRSDFEKSLDFLNEHISKKDIKSLNQLIENLLPCVLSKDVKCIKKYTVSSVDVEKDSNYVNFKYIPPVIDSEYMKELKKCLDYKNLLPHLMGTRGEKKVCLFFDAANSRERPPKGHFKLFPLVYPEGVRKSDSMGDLNIGLDQ